MTQRKEMVERRRQAGELFVRNGLQGQEIAKLIGVSEKTISQWRAADGWDRQRVAMTITKDEEVGRMYSMLNELTTAIKNRPEGSRFPDAKEADTITKLSTSIKKLESETGLAHTVDAFIGFFNFLRKKDLKKAQEFSTLSDDYIKSLLT